MHNRIHCQSCHLHSVGNPFLGAVDNPVLAVFRLLRSSLQTLDITSRKRFGYSQRDELLARQDIADDALPQLRISEIEHWWQPNDGAGFETVAVAARPNACKFLGYYELYHPVRMFTREKVRYLTSWK